MLLWITHAMHPDAPGAAAGAGPRGASSSDGNGEGVAADRLVIFAKRPEPGHVKTRLTPPLSREAGAEVYEACLRDVVQGADAECRHVEIWYQDRQGARDFFATEFPGHPLRPQVTGDLGLKMVDAFRRSFAAGAERVVIIGSDAPGLPRGRLRQGFGGLRAAQAVLGPTDDGGYYLVGIQRDAWEAAEPIFRDIPWSTSRVYSLTRQRAREAGMRLATLPLWYDVDLVADLRRVAPYLPASSHLGRWLAGPVGRRFVGEG